MRNNILHRDLKINKIKNAIQDKAINLYERAEQSENPEVKSLGTYDPEKIPGFPKIIVTNRYTTEWEY